MAIGGELRRTIEKAGYRVETRDFECCKNVEVVVAPLSNGDEALIDGWLIQRWDSPLLLIEQEVQAWEATIRKANQMLTRCLVKAN